MVSKEWWDEDACLFSEDSLKKKQMPTYTLIWSTVTLGKTCISTSPESLCPQTPRYGKQAFAASQSRAQHTAVPRYRWWCQFGLSALLPALTELCDDQTCAAWGLRAIRLPRKPTHTFPGNERPRCRPSCPKHAVLSFCPATYVSL